MKPGLKTISTLVVLGFIAHAASAEDITISTYYPSPYGSYQELETTGQTTLAATSGNVGIRNSAPLTLLDIGSTTLPTDAMINVNAAANRQTGINFQSAGTNSWAMYKPPSSTNLRFWDGTTDRVTFANGGNVGIGTTTPTAKLDVVGTVTSSNLQVTGTATPGTACSPNGLIAQDGTGKILSCQSGTWQGATGGGGGGLATKLGLNSAVPWPDYIVCNGVSAGNMAAKDIVLFLAGKSRPYGALFVDDGAAYVNPIAWAGSTWITEVGFTPAGAFQNSYGPTGDCAGQSISVLVAAGKTGNF